MPAVTADDLLVLPRIARPAAATTQRPVLTTVQSRETFEGEGFPVRRPFPGKLASRVTDPFLLLDHMGAVEYAPGEAEGHALAPAPRLRDRDLHHRRRVRAPGLHRRRRPDRRRRHPVDDRRLRPAAHRDSPPERSSPAAACSTASSSGSTCRRR